MTMDGTPRWDLPLLFAAQAQKEIFHNEALTRIDMLLHGQVESADLAVPPATPLVGACWIAATGATGTWSGRDGQIAGWTEGGWRFVAPRAGLCLDVADRGHGVRFNGTTWQDMSAREDGFYIDGERVVGERQAAIIAPTGGTTVDSEARFVIATILGMLRTHGLIAT